MKPGKKKALLAAFLGQSVLIRWLLLVLVPAAFAIVLYPGIIITRPFYQIGDVAERDIKASHDFDVEDIDATRKKRREAADAVLTVYDYNTLLTARISGQVEKAFQLLREVFEPVPVTDDVEGPASDPENAAQLISDRVWQLKPDFEKELGISVSKGAFKLLEKESFSPDISGVIIRILEDVLNNGVVASKDLLLREADRGIILQTVNTKEEQTVRQLDGFYGLDQAKSTVRRLGQPLIRDMNYSVGNLIVDFCQRLVQPNITLNRSETEERKKKAEQAVPPVLSQIKAGEMLLREGERVTESQLMKLRALRSGNHPEKKYIRSTGAILILACLLMTIWFLHIKQRGQRILKTNRELLFISTVILFFFLLPGMSRALFGALAQMLPFPGSGISLFFGVPMAAGAMIVCLFMGFEMAISIGVILAICGAMILQGQFEVFIYFFLSSLMGSHWLKNCRERKVFVRAGVKLALLNALLTVAVSFYMGEISWGALLANCIFGFAGGIGAGILTAGLVPLLEMAFDYTTDITLLELANLERPILRRMMMEAPGTYHHCVVVGSMVEAAAAEIGANPLLAKVCGYYHDVGKIRKPLYFIENQSDGQNRHDKLAPSMSGLILISHVKDGVEIARKHRLGPHIMDAIQQHHGTSLIAYFYEKAKKLKGEDAVNMENYRYPGPKPQTREIGLVMLADVVEAASRTLENPTPSRIQNHVQTLINKIFADGQLDNCELTLRDLHNIAKSFNKILNGIHHHRIEYPEKGAGKGGKDKNGHTHQQPPESGKHSGGDGGDDRTGRLKRLGVS